MTGFSDSGWLKRMEQGISFRVRTLFIYKHICFNLLVDNGLIFI